MLLGVVAHFRRVTRVGADLARERQNLFDVNGALVGGEVEDVREVGGEVGIRTCDNVRDPPGTVFSSLQFRRLCQPLPVNPKASHRDVALVKEGVEGFAGREPVEDHPVADVEVAGQFLEMG